MGDLVIVCDTPHESDRQVFHHELVVRGWALNAERVEVELNGTYFDAQTGLDSADVHDMHPDVEGSDRARFELRLATAALPRGTLAMSIVATGAGGETCRLVRGATWEPYEAPGETSPEALAQGSIVLHCDRPALSHVDTIQAPVTIRGWCFAEVGVKDVEVILDEQLQLQAMFPLPRFDVRDRFGSAVGLSGFELGLGLEVCPPGAHSLTVLGRIADGRTVGRSIRFICSIARDEDSAAARTPPAPRGPTEAPSGNELENAERFVPGVHGGTELEVEHRARYRWAAGLASGRAVLDAACGVGYGTEILAAAGAARAVGIDTSEAALIAARGLPGARAEFLAADVRDLPFADGEFDLVVSFETIEHVEDPERALDELHRVLRADGLLVISSPNRDVYSAGGQENPWHQRELNQAEFADALGARFANVRLGGQQRTIATIVGDLVAQPGADGEEWLGAALISVAPVTMTNPVYCVALASDAPLPDHPGLVMLMEPDVARDHVRTLELSLKAAKEQAIASLAKTNDAANSHQLALRARIKAERSLEAARDAAVTRAADTQRRLDETERWLQEHRGSVSWRVTRPLRWAKRALNR